MTSDLQRSPIHLLHRAGQCAADIFRAELERSELTPRQLAILISIAENEGESQTVLVERTGVDRSTLADVVRRMQKKGLVQRRRTREDARAYSVKLTEAGPSRGASINGSSRPFRISTGSSFLKRYNP